MEGGDWGDTELVLDEGTPTIDINVEAVASLCASFHSIEGGVVAGEGLLEGEEEVGEEGGGWDVGDDDLELPPDLVS